MKHATADALDRLEPVLAKLRAIDSLVERKRGVFYRKSKALLHFHEDPAGLFADLKIDAEFRRFAVNSAADRRALISQVKQAASG